MDKVGPRRSFFLAAIWWSVFTAATAFARGFWSLITLRFLLGAGGSPAPSTAAKVVATWFPKQERNFATSIWDSGSRVGAVVTLPIVTGIIALLHWHAVFVIIGAIGIVWALVWWRIYRDPRQHPKANEAEIAYLEEGGARTAETDAAEARKIPWRSLFRYRTVLSVMFGFFGAIPGLFAVLAGWSGGLPADRAIRRGASVTRVRKTVIVGGLRGGFSVSVGAAPGPNDPFEALLLGAKARSRCRTPRVPDAPGTREAGSTCEIGSNPEFSTGQIQIQLAERVVQY